MKTFEQARDEALAQVEAMKGLGFEEFRDMVCHMFVDSLGVHEMVIKEVFKHNQEIRDSLIKTITERNKKEFDAAFDAYRGLTDRTIMLEWTAYSLLVMFRKLSRKPPTDEDRGRFAALFGIDADAVPKGAAGMLWKLLEKETSTGEIPDFRTVEPETEEEAQIQRFFEVLRAGGNDWDILRDTLSLTWGRMVRRNEKEIEKEGN